MELNQTNLSQSDKNKMALIQTSLGAAVPLWQMRIMENPDPYFERSRLDGIEKVLCEHGDDFLFKSKKPGGTAAAFNAVAEGIAIISFAPGGVDIFGLHFEGKFPDTMKPKDKRRIIQYLKERFSNPNRVLLSRDQGAKNKWKFK